MPQYHPTISVLLLTLQGVKSPLLLSSIFLVSLLLCRSTRGAPRASFELSGNNGFSLLATSPHAFAPLCPHHSPTRFSENFTRTNTYIHRPHISSPRLYHQQQMSNEKKNPLSHHCCVRLGGRHGSCITTAAPRAAIGGALVCIIFTVLFPFLFVDYHAATRRLEVHD